MKKSKAKFKLIYRESFNGNGKTYDEAATHEAFEDYVGGSERAFRLLWLWQNSYATGTILSMPCNFKTKNDVFIEKAKKDGFHINEIDAFLML